MFSRAICILSWDKNPEGIRRDCPSAIYFKGVSQPDGARVSAGATAPDSDPKDMLQGTASKFPQYAPLLSLLRKNMYTSSNALTASPAAMLFW